MCDKNSNVNTNSYITFPFEDDFALTPSFSFWTWEDLRFQLGSQCLTERHHNTF